jgi:ADP-ribose pyrophosphatase YjhB (NUDIX family)
MEEGQFVKNSHCSYCGHRFRADQPWPRTCERCGNVSFLNPIPVTVVLIPVDDGVLVIRRGIEPRRGKLALPGGYVNLGETWQEAGAREVLEETGLTINPEEITPIEVASAPDGTLVVVGQAQKRTREDLPPFHATEEATERLVLTTPAELAFPLHTNVVARFLEKEAGS